jgi:hypothetical protein
LKILAKAGNRLLGKRSWTLLLYGSGKHRYSGVFYPDSFARMRKEKIWSWHDARLQNSLDVK